MKKRYAMVAVFTGLQLGLLCSFGQSQIPVSSLQVLSKTYSITRKYKSMEGPASTQPLILEEGKPPELVWITGFRTEIVGEDGKTPTSQEFMCHINLDADMQKHEKLFGWTKSVSSRLFTLSQAQFSVDFPKGFGMPVMSNESFHLSTQVLNHNIENPNVLVRHKVTVDFIRDVDLTEPMKPLFATNAFVMRLLEGQDGNYGMPPGEDGQHGPSCMPGLNAKAAGQAMFPDRFGRKFSGHWVVDPGRIVSHTNVTKVMNVPFDTTIHYINIHLHPFAEWIELTDLTTGKGVFKSHARGPKQGIGLEHIDSFSSQKGIPVFKGHEYDLAVSYNNTSGIKQDAMATMFIYLLDKEFKKTAIAPAVLVATAPLSTKDVQMDSSPLDPTKLAEASKKRVLLKTTLGDLLLSLDIESAPRTVLQFLALVNTGAYNTVPIINIQPGFVMQVSNVYDRLVPLSEAQRLLVHKLPVETGTLKHKRGVLSMAREPNDRNSAESSFCILLGDAPQLDGAYTAFGKVEKGLQVLEAIEGESRDSNNRPKNILRIERAEVLNAKAASKASKTLSFNVHGLTSSPASMVSMTRERLVLHTTLGDMRFKLFSDIAPQTVEQILRLTRAGIYDSVGIFRVEPGFVAQVSTAQDRKVPLSPEQQALLHKLPPEFSALRHRRGVLSMAREDNDVNSAESSFSILLGDAPHLDGKYTIFGELESGSDVLSAIEKAPRKGNIPETRIEILKAELINPA